MVYCTLFDSNYLDKAKVMIDSLIKVDANAMIYILCMDSLSKDIIDKLEINQCVTIALSEFEDEELLKVKGKRSRGEYCWTCTAKLIKYVLVKFNHYMCTYIDSDLRFYSDPKILIDEMKSKGCTVQVISHNFPNNRNGRKLEKESGKNCVQFNTFSKSEESMGLLQKWIDQCLDECSVDSAGDQLYTSDWDKYPFVNISENIGAGVAPWNVGKFYAVSMMPTIRIRDTKTGIENDLVFYHFQNLTNTDRYHVVINPLLTYWKIDKAFIKEIYHEYITELEIAKRFFESEYSFLPLVCQYITDGRSTPVDYIKRVLHSPIGSAPIIARKISLSILRMFREKESKVDSRELIG